MSQRLSPLEMFKVWDLICLRFLPWQSPALKTQLPSSEHHDFTFLVPSVDACDDRTHLQFVMHLCFLRSFSDRCSGMMLPAISPRLMGPTLARVCLHMFGPGYFARICQVFSPETEADVPEGKSQKERERWGRSWSGVLKCWCGQEVRKRVKINLSKLRSEAAASRSWAVFLIKILKWKDEKRVHAFCEVWKGCKKSYSTI